MKIATLLLVEDNLPREAALNMAVDQALLETAQSPVLRVYRWARPCVSIGYFDLLSEARESFPGLPVVRRWTGGGSVLHGSDWPYSVIVPRSHPFAQMRPAESYLFLHGALQRALGASAAGVHLTRENAPRQSAACFENPVTHDLQLGGQKIAGAGQRRSRQGLLHQGSLQPAGDIAPPGAERLAEEIANAFERAPLLESTLRRAEQIAAERYATRAWLERR